MTLPQRRRPGRPEAPLDVLFAAAGIGLAATLPHGRWLVLMGALACLAWALSRQQARLRRRLELLSTGCGGEPRARRTALADLADRSYDDPPWHAAAIAQLAQLELVEGDPRRGRELFRELRARGWSAAGLPHGAEQASRWEATLAALDAPLSEAEAHLRRLEFEGGLLARALLALRRAEPSAVGPLLERHGEAARRHLEPVERRALHLLWAHAEAIAPSYRGHLARSRSAILASAGPMNERELRWLTDRWPSLRERLER